MPDSYTETNFGEKSGIVSCVTPWGKWWQSVNEVHIEIDVPKGTTTKSIFLTLKPSLIFVKVNDNVILDGTLYSVVRDDETIWTLEDRKTLYIVLVKAAPISKETTWAGLLQTEFAADAYTLHEMRKKLDLEIFQMENPGFDFSNAQLQKCYDMIPKPN